MHLLNNYLQAVGKYLPARHRADILQELSANLTAQIEDREAELDRGLTEEEIAAILKRHGHPMVVAGRYVPQRSLIGPALFPIYTYILWRALPIATFVYAIASAAALAAGAHASSDIVGVFLRWPWAMFQVAAWVTLVFAFLEFATAKHRGPIKELRDWNPRDLPSAKPVRERRFDAICGFAASLLLTCWIAAIPRFPWMLLGPGAAYLSRSPIVLAPVWTAAYWPVLLFFVARTAVEFVNAFWTGFREYRPTAELVLHTVSVAGIALFLRAGEYFTLAARPDAPDYRDQVAGLNQGIQVIAALALIVAAAEVVKAARKFFAARNRRLAPDNGVAA